MHPIVHAIAGAAALSKPSRHPKTGIFQFRKRVPEHLRAVVGKREEKRSLGTRDLDEARIRHAVAEHECLKRWRSLEQGQVDLNVRQCRAIAGVLCLQRIAKFEDDVEDPMPWRDELLRLQRERSALTEGPLPSAETLEGLLCAKAVREFLGDRGLTASAATRLRLLRLTTDTFEKAASYLEKAACGNYEDTTAFGFPPISALDAADPAVPMLKAWESYVKQRGTGDATQKRWLPVLTKFVAFAGTDDLARITRKDVLAWKAHLLETELDPRTISDVYLASVKAVLGQASVDGQIGSNPAERIRVAYRKKPRTREQGFTRDEAYFVLDHCSRVDATAMSRDRAAALRWVPWLCAYSGARVGEITQMRPCDIYRTGRDLVMMRITPEAGTQKGGSFRDLAIHSHLIAQGFLGYVLACGQNPLFYDPARARKDPDPVKLSAKTSERLAAWVRSIGISDPRVQPNHAWRHRFASLTRNIGMRLDFAELAMGHAPNGASKAYGNHWPVFVKKQIELIEPYDMPNLPLLNAGEISLQIAKLPNWPRSTGQPAADAKAIFAWKRNFRVPEPKSQWIP